MLQLSWKGRQLLQTAAKAIAPPPPRTADKWAEENRVLPRTTAEPGPWRGARVPFLLPILRTERDPRYKRIVVACGSQMGKTDSLVANLIGYRLDDDPVPLLYLGPTRSFVESVFEPRLMSMLNSAETLWNKTLTGKAMTRTKKMVGGVPLRLAWAGSASELAGDAVGMACCDERDRMPDNVGGEGDPGELLETRVATYPDGKVIYTSTPTVGSVDVEPGYGALEHWADAEDCASPIWRLWQEGTRHEWSWPCPECEQYFIPRLRNLWWPDGSTPGQALREARMVCPACGSLIDDSQKTWMNRNGRFVAPGQWIDDNLNVTGDPKADSDTASFWISGLASPWRTWGERAQQYVAAVRASDPNRIQVALNTGLGELFRVSGDAPDWQEVANKREPYRQGNVADEVQFLTAGVDVQKDRLYYVVRGWGYRSESWLIQHGELWGETEKDQVWNDLGELLYSDFDGLSITTMLVDSGYRPGKDRYRRPQNKVYAFCRRFQGKAVAAKGYDQQDRPIKKTRVDIDIHGAKVRKGVLLVNLDSDHYKSWVHSRLEWPTEEPGSFHLPEDATDDYCQQLVAESRAVKPSGQVVWVQQRKDNHYLDCEYLARAAAELNNVDHLAPSSGGRQKRKDRTYKEANRKTAGSSGWMNNQRGWMKR